MAPLVYGIDHFYVPLRDSEGAFRFLTDELNLPIAWPYSTYGDFASGGINLGNANLELLMDSPIDPTFRAESPARVRGIAFHPVPTDELVAGLDRRGVSHGPPAIFPPGTTAADAGMWTNTTIEGLTDEGTSVFACEYHLPGVYDYGQRAAVLGHCAGGLLGVTGVREVLLGSRRVTESAKRWQAFLDPIAPRDAGVWEFEHGPALLIHESDHDAVEDVVLSVKSVRVAETLANELARRLEGLRIRFVA